MVPTKTSSEFLGDVADVLDHGFSLLPKEFWKLLPKIRKPKSIQIFLLCKTRFEQFDPS